MIYSKGYIEDFLSLFLAISEDCTRIFDTKLGTDWQLAITDMVTYGLITKQEAYNKYMQIYNKSLFLKQSLGISIENFNNGLYTISSTQSICYDIDKIDFRLSEGILHSVCIYFSSDFNFILTIMLKAHAEYSSLRFLEEKEAVYVFNDNADTSIALFREQNLLMLTLT